jgi:hypothetical protein
MGKSYLDLKFGKNSGDGTPFDGRYTGRSFFDLGVGSFGRPKWWDGEKWVWYDLTACSSWTDDWPDLQGSATEIEDWGGGSDARPGTYPAGDSNKQYMDGEIQSVGDVDWAFWETSTTYDYRVKLISESGKSFRVTFLGIVPGVDEPYQFIANTTTNVTSDWTQGRTGVGMHVRVGPTTPGDDYGDYTVEIERQLHVYANPAEGEDVTHLETNNTQYDYDIASGETKWYSFTTLESFDVSFNGNNGVGSGEVQLRCYDPVTNLEIEALYAEARGESMFGELFWQGTHGHSTPGLTVYFSLTADASYGDVTGTISLNTIQ